MEFVVPYVPGVFKGLTAEIISKVIVYGLGPLIAMWFLKKFKSLRQLITAPFLGAVKIQRARKAINSDSGLWLAIPVENHKISRPNCDVVMVANLKGGVGKTTLTANLAAACARKRELETLCIDFDYQGSLTSMAVPDFNSALLGIQESPAGKLIRSPEEELNLALLSTHHSSENHLRTIAADYPLAQIENRLMINWLLGDNKADLRQNLAKQLESCTFERVFIDAPPRLTTSCVQGIFASTKVIIPTVLDRLSTEAVGRFVEQLIEFKKQQLSPYLRKIYVVGTIVPNDNTSQSEHEFLTQAMLQYGDFVSVVPLNLSVRSRAYLRNAAGKRIAYLDKGDTKALRDIRQIFDNLADHIWC